MKLTPALYWEYHTHLADADRARQNLASRMAAVAESVHKIRQAHPELKNETAYKMDDDTCSLTLVEEE